MLGLPQWLGRYSANTAAWMSPPLMNFSSCYEKGYVNGIHVGDTKKALAEKVFQSELLFLTWKNTTKPYNPRTVRLSSLKLNNALEFEQWLEGKQSVDGTYQDPSKGVSFSFSANVITEICIVKINTEAW